LPLRYTSKYGRFAAERASAYKRNVAGTRYSFRYTRPRSAL